MAEVGCLKDECLQNLQVEGLTDLNQVTYREKIELLVDLAGAGVNRSALTMQDSGKHFLVPALTGGTQTIALPKATADNVGFTCKFTMIDTAAEIFSVETVGGTTKILIAKPDGDGTVTKTSSNKMQFLAAAALGASFRITCISATVAIAFTVSEIQSGVVGGKLEHTGA